MTLQIQHLDLTKLRQEEDLGFHQLASAETARCTDDAFTPLQTAYTDALAAFDDALKTGGASILSPQLADLDAQRDRAYSALATQINNALNHFDPAKAAAARQARLLLDRYGSPTALPYIEENAVIHNLVQDLTALDTPTPAPSGNNTPSGDNAPDVSNTPSSGSNSTPGTPSDDTPSGSDPNTPSDDTPGPLTLIGAREWLDHLAGLNTRFVALFAQRNAEQSSTVTGASTAARTALDAAYTAAVTRLNALAEVYGPDPYAPIITALNRLIDRQRAVLAARRTTNANASTPKSPTTPDTPTPDTPNVPQ